MPLVDPCAPSPLSPTAPPLERIRSFAIGSLLEDRRVRIGFDGKRTIGRGGQGQIYLVYVDILDSSDRVIEVRPCVLKKLVHFFPTDPSEGLFNIHRAVTAADETTRDHSVLKLIAIVQYREESYALLPYCEAFLDRTLPLLNNSDTKKTLPDLLRLTVIILMMDNLLSALEYMHENGFVHLDIKHSNIGLHLGKWCLIDLDISARIGQHRRTQGTPHFFHPKKFRDSAISTQPMVDIYALGIVLHSLLNATFWHTLSTTPLVQHMVRSLADYDSRITDTPKSIEPFVFRHDTASIETRLLYLAEQMTSLNEGTIPSATELRPAFSELYECILTLEPNIRGPLGELYKDLATEQAPPVGPSWSAHMFSRIGTTVLDTSYVTKEEKLATRRES